MTYELTYLLLTALMTGLLWIPVVMGYVQTRGFLKPADYVTLPDSPLPDWVQRANRAHQNAVENFSPFAAAIIIGHLLDFHSGLTVFCAAVFFWARLAHVVIFITGFNKFMARTVIFGVAWAAWLLLTLAILTGA